MNRHIELERSVSVRCWRVVGQIAKAGKRTELMAVLLRASENDGTDAGDLAGHLLFEPRSRRVVAERLLHIGVAYGLLEEKGSRIFVPTEAGRHAISTGEVFVPEDGAWTLWASDDPLLPSPVLRIESWNDEPSAYAEVAGNKRESARERRPGTLPEWLREVIKTPVTPAAGHAATVRIDHLEEQAEPVEVDGWLRLRWNVGDGRLQLSGTLERKQEGRRWTSTELAPPPVELGRIWRALLENEGLWKQWDDERQALRVSFDETKDAERETMSRDLEFTAPDLPGYGKFESLTVPGVAITAKSETHAQAWAKWRLNARIRDYATSERYADWCAEAAAPFDRYEIKLPTRAGLARELWMQEADRPEPRAWRVVAAEDWSL